MPTARKDIVRTKTGCYTCRRRHKKCDEGKPSCWNCTRNRLDCEGYQPASIWSSKTHRRSDARRDSTSTRKSTHSTTEGASVESQAYSGLASTEPDAPVQQNMSLRRCLDRQPEVAVQDDSSNSFSSPDVAVEAVSNSSPLQFQAATSDSDDGYVPPMESSYGRLDIYNCERTSPPDLLGNIVLPSLVFGVQTPLERRLLHYFIGTFSKILISTPSTDLNAINNVVLPMALQDEQDWGLLNLILSLSASHLSRALSRQTVVDDAEDRRKLEKTKWKHYSYALTRHARNLFWVIQQNHSAQGEQEPEVSQIDYAIAATMLLCQWSTCEGGDEANWRIHLDANRDLVRRKFTQRPNALPSALSDTSQILLEWFYFHDILATVTSPERPCISISAEIMDAFGVSGAAEVLPKCFSNKPLLRSLWIGVNDGLLAIIERIIVLRQSTEAHSSTTDDGLASVQPRSQVNTILLTASNQLVMRALKPNQLMEALTIETALHDISLEYSTSQQSLVAQCYRLAASLMLHFTVYPTSSPNQGRAWDCLTQLLTLIEHISEDDSAVTCSLFPLFICGVSVVHEADCQLVLGKVQAYSRYCGLGHTHDVVDFLQKWWKKQDEWTVDGTDQTHCQCNPDLTSKRRERCEAGTIPKDWWRWREFMREENMDLILI
ncbi:C6 transcription factor [Fusarium agapanthi]|uniref:C6 transcription factor n=1 Tax=Fusarium agapanthi TaxID=1803897 RepID=A0A9P5B3W3_9HYPO|nr:C6 transcription factor [Fusarium agapanthi]